VILCQMIGKAIVLVREDQLSLAIGRRGQNVRLGSKLSGWDIEIMTREELDSEIERAVAGFSELDGLEPSLAERLVGEGFLTYDELSVIEPDAMMAMGNLTEEQVQHIVDQAEQKAEAAEAAAAAERRRQREQERIEAATAEADQKEAELQANAAASGSAASGSAASGSAASGSAASGSAASGSATSGSATSGSATVASSEPDAISEQAHGAASASAESNGASPTSDLKEPASTGGETSSGGSN
jgi:N utilization substance protein A